MAKNYQDSLLKVYGIDDELLRLLDQKARALGLVGGKGLQPGQPNRSATVRFLLRLPVGVCVGWAVRRTDDVDS